MLHALHWGKKARFKADDIMLLNTPQAQRTETAS
jgi:hypothetical protein